MCAALAGQCGSRVTHPNSQSQRHLLDEISRLYADRHAELQSIWQDIGEDTWQKLQELSEMVSNAVEEIYEKVLEESMRRKSDLEGQMAKCETPLKEHVGANPLQVIAAMELPLQAPLSMHMAHLKNFHNANVDVQTHIGESVLLKKLCNQVLALREMLKLSPCSSTSLEEVVATTTADLHNLCSGKIVSSWFSYRDRNRNECPRMFQLLHQFYRTLRTMETVEMNLLFIEATEKAHEKLHDCGTSVSPSLQDSGETITRKRSFEHSSTLTSSCNASAGCRSQYSSPRPCSLSKGSRLAKLLSDDITTLEKLGRKILGKLEDIMKHMKCAGLRHADTYTCSSCMGTLVTSEEATESHTLVEEVLSLEENRSGTQALVLTGSYAKNFTSFSQCVRGAGPSTWQENCVLGCSQSTCEAVHCQDQSNTIDSNTLNGSLVAQCAKDLKIDNAKEHFVKQNYADTSVNTVLDSCTSSKHHINAKELQNITCTASKRWPLIPITNNQLASVSIGKPWHALSYPPPPPPPPPPLQQPPQLPSLIPPPPPLPPPPSFCRAKAEQPCKSVKLKKSANLSRLYIGMKKKAEGAASSQSATADVAVQRRALVGIGAHEGMAGALAEITKRSAYFRKIEDDVNKQANSILEMKSRLEIFETDDMNELLKFHRSMEAQLEQLTDESQVLARFEGFPIKKLETVRAAASLHLRLTSLVEQIENWVVDPPPLSEQLEKVTALFDKLKTDVEAIERTKDEDFQRFNSQKIRFDFDSINCIKEATVQLSSQCLASTLKESHKTKKNMTIGEAYLCTKEINKQRTTFQMLYKAFQLAYRVHNFAGGHDERAEQLCSEVALEMEAYPSGFWVELVNKL